jgi:hypothetical protein
MEEDDKTLLQPVGAGTPQSQIPNPKLPGDLPGFRFLEVAGQGGMGTVYKAEQAAPRRLVAIKLLHKTAAQHAFYQEARLIAQLEHPHILPVYTFGEHGGAPFLVMRYLEGGSVAGRIQVQGGPLELATAVRWASQAADALDYAHQRGIVHKDVKPSNLLLDPAGHVYLADFGIAGALQTTPGSAAVGSPAYMPPEQARGQPVDARADVYALAVTLFEMVTGRPPYTAETALGVMVRHMQDPVPSARALNPAVPPALDDLLRRGMVKEREARPASMAEFGRALRLALDSPATVAVKPAAAAPRRPSWLVWGGVVVLLGLCLFLLLGGGGLAAYLFGRATPTPAPNTPRPTPGELFATDDTVPATPLPDGVLLADDFSDPTSGFALAADADGGVAYDGEALRFTILTEGVQWSSPSGRVAAADVYLEVEVAWLTMPEAGEIAVLCRWQDADNYTAFGLNGRGEYAIWQERGGERVTLQDWTASPLLSGESSYTLQITCDGPLLRLAVERVILAEAADAETPVAGDIAFSAVLRGPGELDATFDNLRVTVPE